MPSCSADQIYTLSEGDPSQIGNRALIAAGTGLGEGLLTWNGRIHVPYPSEGGHADYAPRNEDEIDLLRFLKQKYNGRISFERVVSGMGMTNIYEFLREVRGMEEPAWLAERMAAAGDPNAVITELGLAAKSEICEKTLDMFVSAYGAEAGNLALKVLSVGGMYVGGGIAPRILEKLKDGTFMKAFTDKGRLSQLLINMPVRVILESRAALMGAAALCRGAGRGDERDFAAGGVDQGLRAFVSAMLRASRRGLALFVFFRIAESIIQASRGRHQSTEAAAATGRAISDLNHRFCRRRETCTSRINAGTSTSGPMTAAKAAPELSPKTATATAMASSKLLLAAVKESVAVLE